MKTNKEENALGSELSKARHNGIVSYLKFLATGMVFICHAWIYSKDAFGLELQPNWQIFLKTPAWGGMDILYTRRILIRKRIPYRQEI